MKKIPSVFCRNYEGDYLVRDEVVPGCEWVLAGEGAPTIKHDGTPHMVRAGALFKRYDAKSGRTPPAGFEPCQDPDPETGHWPGWIPVIKGNPADRWAFEAIGEGAPVDGTYELCGPKINGNPEKLAVHRLLRHGGWSLSEIHGPRTFTQIRSRLEHLAIEGIVWHHVDGRMAKIKRKDFGLAWPVAERF